MNHRISEIGEVLNILNKLKEWDLLIAIDLICILFSVKYAKARTVRIVLIVSLSIMGLAIIAAKTFILVKRV